MSSPKELHIPIQSELARYSDFMSLPNNDRIIFSGIFGSGKTTFLRKFFEDRKEDYFSIHLYPTNYSVSQNEDIFEYIKYDILYEILGKETILERIEVSKSLAFGSLSAEDYYSILKDFVKSIPEIGKFVINIIDPLESLIKKISAQAGKYERDDAKKIAAFESHFKLAKGSLYEYDFYTELITKLIEQLKEVGRRKVVLIVDDLDRIDPEHIFRILNVLAVHFNQNRLYEYENKFSLDKIVLCCDIENVRSIFKARYGVATNFNGYIDKFYSKEIYHFDNRKMVGDAVESILKSINSQLEKTNGTIGLNVPTYFEIYKLLLIVMIQSNCLNLRTLLKLLGVKYPYTQYSISFVDIVLENYRIRTIQLFDFLIALFGTPESVLTCLQNCNFQHFERLGYFERHVRILFYESILILDFPNHRFNSSRKDLVFRGYPYAVGGDSTLTAKATESNGTISLEIFKEFFIEAFEVFVKLRP